MTSIAQLRPEFLAVDINGEIWGRYDNRPERDALIGGSATPLWAVTGIRRDPRPGRCRSCGCTDYRACLDPVSRLPCHWAEPDLCSVCADELGGA